MIQLFLTRDLALHVASHLPEDDPLRTGISELIAEQDLLGGCIDEAAPLAIYQRGRMVQEIYTEADAERLLQVLSAPRALQAVILADAHAYRRSAALEAAGAAAGGMVKES